MTNTPEETKHASWIEQITQLLFRKPQNKEQLLIILREAQKRNLVDTDTLAMIESVIQFSEMKVRDIMIPRNQMVTVSVDADVPTLFQIVQTSGHSRFPVIGEHRDEVIGILHAKNLIAYRDSEKFTIHDILKPVTFIPESKRLDILLKEFRLNRNHMAIVVDEYGSVSGFVTIEDLIEQIVGDIEDEFDIDEDAYIKKHSDDQYILKAHMPIEDFNEYFSVDFPDEEFDTISGMILKKLGYVPKKGEKIQLDNFVFKIISADNRRVKLLQLKVKPNPPEHVASK